MVFPSLKQFVLTLHEFPKRETKAKLTTNLWHSILHILELFLLCCNMKYEAREKSNIRLFFSAVNKIRSPYVNGNWSRIESQGCGICVHVLHWLLLCLSHFLPVLLSLIRISLGSIVCEERVTLLVISINAPRDNPRSYWGVDEWKNSYNTWVFFRSVILKVVTQPYERSKGVIALFL